MSDTIGHCIRCGAPVFAGKGNACSDGCYIPPSTMNILIKAHAERDVAVTQLPDHPDNEPAWVDDNWRPRIKDKGDK